MNSRQRFADTMQHQEPGRVPIDFGATSLTGMRPGSQEKLKKCLGFSGPAEAESNGIDLRILEWAGTDFRAVGEILDLPRCHTGKVSETAEIDCWGVRRDFIDGDWQITESPLIGSFRRGSKIFQLAPSNC